MSIEMGIIALILVMIWWTVIDNMICAQDIKKQQKELEEKLRELREDPKKIVPKGEAFEIRFSKSLDLSETREVK